MWMVSISEMCMYLETRVRIGDFCFMYEESKWTLYPLSKTMLGSKLRTHLDMKPMFYFEPLTQMLSLKRTYLDLN
jgi:hypothetical protein